MATSFWKRLRLALEMIKFEHSIFALPFALTGAMLAVRGWPAWRQVLWLVVAMVGARSAAMTFNRIADLKLDALNPRTRSRALPTGQISLRFALGFTLLHSGLRNYPTTADRHQPPCIRGTNRVSSAVGSKLLVTV